MKRDGFVDFFAVEPHQRAMHKRLENWARSCNSAGGGASSAMFRLYRPAEHWARETPIPVDFADSRKIAQGIALLPEIHRHAVQWNYLEGGSPLKIRRKLGVTSEFLMRLIRDARQMLINRGV